MDNNPMNNLVSLALFYKFNQSKNSLLLEVDEKEYSYEVLLEVKNGEWRTSADYYLLRSAWDKAYVFYVAPDLEQSRGDVIDLLSGIFPDSRRPKTLYLLYADRAVQLLNLQKHKRFTYLIRDQENKTIVF